MDGIRIDSATTVYHWKRRVIIISSMGNDTNSTHTLNLSQFSVGCMEFCFTKSWHWAVHHIHLLKIENWSVFWKKVNEWPNRNVAVTNCRQTQHRSLEDILYLSHFFSVFIFSRYVLMRKCWLQNWNERPSFTAITQTLDELIANIPSNQLIGIDDPIEPVQRKIQSNWFILLVAKVFFLTRSLSFQGECDSFDWHRSGYVVFGAILSLQMYISVVQTSKLLL